MCDQPCAASVNYNSARHRCYTCKRGFLTSTYSHTIRRQTRIVQVFIRCWIPAGFRDPWTVVRTTVSAADGLSGFQLSSPPPPASEPAPTAYHSLRHVCTCIAVFIPETVSDAALPHSVGGHFGRREPGGRVFVVDVAAPQQDGFQPTGYELLGGLLCDFNRATARVVLRFVTATNDAIIERRMPHPEEQRKIRIRVVTDQ
jgi:hypothetical protein